MYFQRARQFLNTKITSFLQRRALTTLKLQKSSTLTHRGGDKAVQLGLVTDIL